MRVHDSQAYRKMDVTRERISRILERREILLPIQTGFSLVNAAVVCAILESIPGLDPSSVITEPRYLKRTKEEMGRQHQGMDRPRVRQVPEDSGEQGKWRKSVAKLSVVPQRPSRLRD